ncbi:ORF-61-like protein [Peridroma alphabaculovirus]|uniref:ORF-61-like protein n=1 Tax=Peridroma alphabaculovirus TaxID=1346829 RepID=A0A068LL39_9ABAC|nr:ORF-61-like protein [Peridroma alphabaculovirus]AIE47863.1 ORF-61-like protein [Peridroma alphabaculovirus]
MAFKHYVSVYAQCPETSVFAPIADNYRIDGGDDDGNEHPLINTFYGVRITPQHGRFANSIMAVHVKSSGGRVHYVYANRKLWDFRCAVHTDDDTQVFTFAAMPGVAVVFSENVHVKNVRQLRHKFVEHYELGGADGVPVHKKAKFPCVYAIDDNGDHRLVLHSKDVYLYQNTAKKIVQIDENIDYDTEDRSPLLADCM